MDPLQSATATAFSGLYVQSLRLKLVSENLANADATGHTPGADPYRRKTISFSNVFDSVQQANVVVADASGKDQSAFPTEHLPGHPAADKDGNVKTPNVNPIIEMADMRQALRSYEANLQVIKQSRDMAASLVDLLRSGG